MLEEVHHRGKLLEYIILPYFRILSLSFMAALGDDSFLHVPSYKTVSSNPNAKFAPAEHSLESSSNALPRWNQYISLSLFSFPLPFFFSIIWLCSLSFYSPKEVIALLLYWQIATSAFVVYV